MYTESTEAHRPASQAFTVANKRDCLKSARLYSASKGAIMLSM